MIVLLSGGQDSTTCLHWALRSVRGTAATLEAHGERRAVHALAVDYGQRHVVELASAHRVAHAAGVQLHVAHVEMPEGSLAGLAEGAKIEKAPSGLPTTFVPGRNVTLLSIAANLAYRTGASDIVIGCSAVDYSGYPDCRPEFLTTQARAIALALDRPIRIMAPLIDRSKAQTVQLARELGPECWSSLAHTWTCYLGGERPCGTCPACVLRAKGFAEAGETDPAL